MTKALAGAIETSKVIGRKGTGRADYQVETFRGKQMFGYVPEYGESYLWLCNVYVPTPPGPGASVITFGALPVGVTEQVVDAFTGNSQLTIAAGYDYLLKEFWVSFDQPVEFLLFQGGSYNDVSCIAYFESHAKPVSIFQVGWTRSLLEDIAQASVLRCDIRNVGDRPAYGKIWIIGYTKKGAYVWV